MPSTEADLFPMKTHLTTKFCSSKKYTVFYHTMYSYILFYRNRWTSPFYSRATRLYTPLRRSVIPLVRCSVGLSVTLYFFGKYGPCLPVRDWGSRVSGLVL